MKPQVKKTLKIVFLFSLTFFFLYLAFRGNNFSELFIVLKNANYFYAIIGAVIGIIIGGYFRAIRWRYFLNPLKKDIGMGILFSTQMIGYMMNSIIPRTGEVYRPVLLANREKISRAAAFGTILAERVFDMLALLISFGICMIFFNQKLSAAFSEYNLETISFYVAVITLAFVILIVIIIFNLEKTEIIIERITKKILPQRFHQKIQTIFISMINGFLFIKYPKYYFQIFLYSLLLWVSYICSIYMTLSAFNIDLNIFDANLVLTMTTFATLVPLPANSAGLYYLFGTATLVNIYGVHQETAFGFSIVNHLLGTLGLILVGLYFFLKENLDFKKTPELKDTEIISDEVNSN